MVRYPPVVFWLSTALAVVVLLASPAPSSADLQIVGDQKAWGELNAAFQKLLGLPSYKMKLQTATSQGNGTLTWEVLPDRSHATFMLDSGVGEEDITVGGQSAHRLTTASGASEWQCGSGVLPSNAANVADFAKAGQGTAVVSRGQPTTIDNVSMNAYVAVTNSADSSVSTTTTVYVAPTTGLPRRAVANGTASGQSGQITIDYYDFNVPITISLPACKSS